MSQGRSKLIALRLSPGEWREISRAAKQARLSVSHYVRLAAGLWTILHMPRKPRKTQKGLRFSLQ